MRIRRVGNRGLLCEVADFSAVHALAKAAAELPGVDETVPGLRTVLVVASGHVGDVAERLPQLSLNERQPSSAGRPHEIPAVYDGPDLADVAAHCGFTVDEVIQRHSGATYTVAFLGFAPGFPYLVGLDPRLAIPRRASPRTSVPAGSIGIAGEQTGIYPAPSPGGWQLIARTDAVLFDPDRDAPALLAPGNRVRFRPVAELATAAGSRPARNRISTGDLRVERAGPLTTVQDRGRPGWAHLGVPRAGAVDIAALTAANRRVGNPLNAAALECTMHGPALAASHDVHVAVTGADVEVHVDGQPVPTERCVRVPAGGVLDVGRIHRGVRAYVAVRGGIAVDPVLGSRSTDTLSGLGPAPLAAGDELPIGAVLPLVVEYDAALTPLVDAPVVHLQWGPREDVLSSRARQAVLSTIWRVDPRSDRTGVRLDGPPLPDVGDGRLPSEGLLPGAVQIPPDGRPIVFLANAPTTGGYPLVAVVTESGLRSVAQARPGTSLRFTEVMS